jgi:hypothetical protein
MAASESSVRAQAGPRVAGFVWIEPLLGLGLGAMGGALRGALLTTPLAYGVLMVVFSGLLLACSCPIARPARGRD